MDKIEAYIYIVFFVAIIEVIYVNWFLYIKIEPNLIPTLVNGITSSSSVIIGFTGAFIGIMFREMSKKDKKSRNFYFIAIILLILPLTFLWSTYFFLTTGWSEFAVKYALSSLIITLSLFLVIVLRSVKILSISV